ncbi:MAG: hypothetical protein LBH19_12280, partial [Dysgonamonadaceae bacterium]|nr:hypothetical protein [Dysgonamonadaceae bacterium]
DHPEGKQRSSGRQTKIIRKANKDHPEGKQRSSGRQTKIIRKAKKYSAGFRFCLSYQEKYPNTQGRFDRKSFQPRLQTEISYRRGNAERYQYPQQKILVEQPGYFLLVEISNELFYDRQNITSCFGLPLQSARRTG